MFVCAKLEDEFGYALSNVSLVGELLKDSDRITAIPEPTGSGIAGNMHISHDVEELKFMLKNLQQTIVAKFSGKISIKRKLIRQHGEQCGYFVTSNSFGIFFIVEKSHAQRCHYREKGV